MAQITGVIKDKKTKQVTLLLDNGETLVVDPDVAEDKQLVEGASLNEEEVDAIEQSEDLFKAYTRAINFISYRPRSAKEVRQNLERKTDLEPAQIDVVLDRLKKHNWVNDLAFAKWWVGSRLAHRPRGRYVLEQELMQKGLDRSLISQVLGEMAPKDVQLQAIEKLLEKKLGFWRNLPKKELRIKLINFLIRKGFEYTDVVTLVDERVSEEVK